MEGSKSFVLLLAIGFVHGASVSYQVNLLESKENQQPADFQVTKQLEENVKERHPVEEGFHRSVNIHDPRIASEENKHISRDVTFHHEAQSAVQSGFRDELNRAIHQEPQVPSAVQQSAFRVETSRSIHHGSQIPTTVLQSEFQDDIPRAAHQDAQISSADAQRGFRGETSRAVHSTELTTEQYNLPVTQQRAIPQIMDQVYKRQESFPVRQNVYEPNLVVAQPASNLPMLPALTYSSIPPPNGQSVVLENNSWYQGRASLRQHMQTPHVRYVYTHFL